MKIILVDLFGVLYSDSYTPWVTVGPSSESLKQFVVTNRKNKTLPYAEICDSPHNESDYFFRLMKLNDKEGKISDAELYRILSEASGESEEKIREMIHSEVINSDIVSVINTLKHKSNAIVSLASSSGENIVKEMVKKSGIAFDQVFYTVDKASCAWYASLTKNFDVSLQDIYLIDNNASHIIAARKCGVNALQYIPKMSSKNILSVVNKSFEYNSGPNTDETDTATDYIDTDTNKLIGDTETDSE